MAVSPSLPHNVLARGMFRKITAFARRRPGPRLDSKPVA
jgi:hypothetical protein